MAATAPATITRTRARIAEIPYGPEGLKIPVSTRNVVVVAAEFPARSKTVTVTVWDPSARPVKSSDVAEAESVVAAPPSTLTVI